MRTNTQRPLYENLRIWGNGRPETVLERARLTIRAVPNDVKTILEAGSGDGLLIKALRVAAYVRVGLD